MLVELSMVEQRYEAVREVLDSGADVIDVVIRFGVDRRTVHRWLVRYANHGMASLADRSPRHCGAARVRGEFSSGSERSCDAASNHTLGIHAVINETSVRLTVRQPVL